MDEAQFYHERLLEAYQTVTQSVRQMLARRRRIKNALVRLHFGEFGICRQCGHPIKPERLHRLPYAELCFTCQRQEELLVAQETTDD